MSKLCGKCGKELLDNVEFCPKCGHPFSMVNENATPDTVNESIETESADKNLTMPQYNQSNNAIRLPEKKQDSGMKRLVALCLWIVAIIVFIMSMSGAGAMASAAKEMMRITSVGGNSIAEAYYQSHGEVYMGMATVFRAFGIFATATLAFMGIYLWYKPKDKQ